MTCRNRFWQIAQTLPENLKDNAGNKDNVEFILVDFASRDGLGEWVRTNFADELKSGYLKYYYTGDMKDWNMCIAKNTAHNFACNDIVVNLDCDNFTGPNGGGKVARILEKHGLQKTFLHMWSQNDADGSNGRVAVARDAFMSIGGYDEQFEPWGYDEDDLMERLQAAGMRKCCFKNKKYCRAVMNDKGDGIKFEEGGLGLYDMRDHNFNISNNNIKAGRLVANNGRPLGVEAVRMFSNK